MTPPHSNPPLSDDERSFFPATLRRLEERIVLDAAGAATDHPHADHAHPAQADGPPAHAAGHDPSAHDLPAQSSIWQPVRDAVHHAFADRGQTGERLLLISHDVDQADQLRAAAGPATDALIFDDHLTLTQLLELLTSHAGGRQYDSLALATHGLGPGQLALLSEHALDLAALHNPELQAFWRGVAALVAPGGRIDLLACDAGATSGHALVSRLESLTGVDFAASTDATGALAHGGDWLLETDAVHTDALYFDPHRLHHFDAVLAGPTIADTDANPTATGNEGPVVVDPGITVGDGGGGLLRGAAVRIGAGFVAGEDRLDFDHELAASHGVSGSYDPVRGQLLLAGDADATAYQEVLRSVTYENLSDTPDTTPRNMIFVIGDDYGVYKYLPETGHYYRIVAATTNWSQAATNANIELLGGLRGYLATVTSVTENSLLRSLVPALNKAWLGGSDSLTEGAWLWSAGPENGTQFWNGGPAPGGTPTDGMYSNWLASQPDDAGGADSLALDNLGNWSDEPSGVNLRYLVEYGGRSNDTQGQHVARVLVSVVTPNHAPALDNSTDFFLTPINEDESATSGTRIADLIASAGGDRLTDFNSDPEGIAITGLDTTHGAWQYSLDDGATWQTIAAVTDSHALLLADNHLLRFQPAADWNGTLAHAVQFRAWDQSAGSTGTYVDPGAVGGHSAFSSQSGNASLSVAPVNDAPLVNPATVLQFTPLVEDDLSHQGTTVADLLGSATGAVSDVDGDPLGIAVVGLDHAHGAWQYSLDDGATWIDVDSASPTHALLLRDADRLRFLPDANWHGDLANAITFRAWDQTTGSPGNFVSVATAGGLAPFSSGAGAAHLSVQPVNDAPTVVHPMGDQDGSDKSPLDFQVPLQTFADIDGDQLNYSATLADGSPLPIWLTFDPLTRRFSGAPAFDAVGTLALRVLATDTQGASVAADFMLAITHVNSPPAVSQPLADLTLRVDEAFSFQFANTTFTDVDPPDALSYAAALANGQPLPDWLTFDPLTRTFSGTPPIASAGAQLSVRITADDGAGGLAATLFTLNIRAVVNPPPQPPPDVPVEPPPVPPTDERPSRPDNPPPRTEGGTRGGLPDASPSTPQQPAGGHSPALSPAPGGIASSPAASAPASPTPADPSTDSAGASEVTSTAPPGPAGAQPPANDAGHSAGAAAGPAATVHGREEEAPPSAAVQVWEPAPLVQQMQSAVFDSTLITDPSVPVEFRETWSLILGAYTQSGEELAVYLQSAFRTVSEAACIYRAAEHTLASARELLESTSVPLDPDEWLAGVLAARTEVRTASARLEAAIEAAAQAGREGRFDQVLEDVIAAALERLMTANQGLFVEAQALSAISEALRAGQITDAAQAGIVAAAARAAADAEITEMRKSWDRVAQDVFSAFIARLAAQAPAES